MEAMLFQVAERSLRFCRLFETKNVNGKIRFFRVRPGRILTIARIVKGRRQAKFNVLFSSSLHSRVHQCPLRMLRASVVRACPSRRELRYVLYKYENYLRAKARQPLLSPDECTNVFRDVSVSNTLDHITPQTPDFVEYSEEFCNEYLNNIGNLSLLTWGNNSAKKNHNPANDGVVEMYNSIFYSHKEIYETLKSEKKWNEIQISERRDRIVAFIKDNWLD